LEVLESVEGCCTGCCSLFAIVRLPRSLFELAYLGICNNWVGIKLWVYDPTKGVDIQTLIYCLLGLKSLDTWSPKIELQKRDGSRKLQVNWHQQQLEGRSLSINKNCTALNHQLNSLLIRWRVICRQSERKVMLTPWV